MIGCTLFSIRTLIMSSTSNGYYYLNSNRLPSQSQKRKKLNVKE